MFLMRQESFKNFTWFHAMIYLLQMLVSILLFYVLKHLNDLELSHRSRIQHLFGGKKKFS